MATKKTGFAVIVNNKLETFGVIDTGKEKTAFSGNKISIDTIDINNQMIGYFARLKTKLEKKLKKPDEKYEIDFNIILENSNHGLAQVGLKLSVYVGIYASAIINAIETLFVRKNINLKLVNAREWQLRAFGRILDRNDGKEESINLAVSRAEKDWPKKDDLNYVNEDTADAINMAVLAPVLRDNYIVGQQIQGRNKARISNKNNILNAEIRLNKIMDALRNKQHLTILKIETIKKITPETKILRLDIEKKKPLIKFATSIQIKQIKNQKQILINNNASLETINKFRILGVDNDSKR